MLQITKTRQANGSWTWQIGRVVLASAALIESEPGLFFFTISGVHRQGAEPFATHMRAEALLKKHLGCAARIDLRAGAQTIAVRRDARWHKLAPAAPPAQEQDSYSYAIGNVFLAALTNIKSIRLNGYHLYLPLAGGAKTVTVSSIAEGEQQLISALECGVTLQAGRVDYVVGPNHQPGQADWFRGEPTLYDGSPAW